MNSLETRVEFVAGGPFVRSTGRSIEETVRRLEGGEPPTSVAAGAPLDLIAALAAAALGDDSSEGPALARRPPRRPGLANALSAEGLAGVFPRASRVALLTLSAGLSQVHDFWEASHQAAQEADDLGERRFAAYWHAIAHRREPDPGNAAYWFRRVGPNPLLPALAEAAGPLLAAAADDRMGAGLASGGGWDSSVMTELCTRSRAGTPRASLARRLQRLEMGLLLAASAEAAAD